MKEYKATYKHVNNGISYISVINGSIFPAEEYISKMYKESDLKKGVVNHILAAVKRELLSMQEYFLSEDELLQSNGNNAYYVRIEDKVYQISMHVNTTVEFGEDLLKK